MDKDFILAEIKRFAEDNDGKTPGIKTFENFTSIKASDWRGKYWTKWNDAVAEAGLIPNKKTLALDRDEVVRKFIVLIRDAGKLPTDASMRMKSRNDPTFPSTNTIQQHLGNRTERIIFLNEYCDGREDLEDIAKICSAILAKEDNTISSSKTQQSEKGYVYLFKYGKKHFKIGMTKDPLRRLGEVNIDVPEKLEPVHTIETEKPRLVEKFWHDRFKEKHTNGEFFALTPAEVRLFRSIKSM